MTDTTQHANDCDKIHHSGEYSCPAEKKWREGNREVMVRADSLLSLLSYRGYIDYSKQGCPDKYEVEQLIGRLREITSSKPKQNV